MTITRLLRFACGFVLAVLCFTCAAMGQTETATVSGLITDSTGAVVTGAEVKLQSVDRGTTASGTTNNAGIYVFASVHPGPYQITVQKPGFKQVDFLGLIVNVQDHIEQNFRLQVGSISESITVTGNELKVNTTDASVSTVVDRQFAENIPMNGRSFQTLIQLTPGVVVVPSTPQDPGQFSVNGQRASSNYWMVDGVSANAGVNANTNVSFGNGLGGAAASFSALGGTNSLVSVDALQEFRILTSTYAPEFGRTPGGQISIVTRSGTNQWHGSVFDYLRNDLFDANDWFADSKGLKKPEERQNDFGGTFSGRLLKDKTFFFFSYEGLRLRLPQVAITTVPDLNARQTAISAMQPFLKAFPLPNGPEDMANPGAAQFNSSFSNKGTLDAYSIRLDHKLKERVLIFGRYNYSPSEIVNRGGGGSPLSVAVPGRIALQTATVGATWSILPTVTNDLRFNYSRTNGSGHAFLDNFGGAIPLASLPFPTGFTAQNAVFDLVIFSLVNGQALAVGHSAQTIQRQVNLVDSLSVQKGSHSLKFGVDYRRLSPISAPPFYTQTAIFADVPSAATGNSFFGVTSSNAGLTLLFRNLGVFAQDTWRVAPRLTATYGLRWDVDFAPSSLNGPSLVAVTGYSLTDLSKLALAPAGTPPFKTTCGNVAPRVGLAYQVSQNQEWQTVLRGGFGIFYDLVSSEVGNSFSGFNPPFSLFNSFPGGPFPYSSSLIAPPTIPPSGDLSSLYAFNPNLKQPYTMEWNIAIEQALGKQETLSASYVGAAGRRLLQTSEFQNPPENSVVVAKLLDNTATSDYEALQVQFQRRMSRGVQALASYTWSHSIDTGSAGSISPSNRGAPGSNANANRGSSSFDIRNAFSLGLTYDLPTLKSSAFIRMILGGWSLQSIVQARSAPPVEISDPNFSTFNSGVFTDFRPDLVPGQPLYLHGSQYPGGKAFNPAAFTDSSIPTDPNTGNPLRQGNVPRNFLRGFGATQWDFAIHRDFPIHESLHLQFRAEMFNVLNHPNFGQPNGAFGRGGFGLSTQMLGTSLSGGGGNLGGGAFDPLYQIGGPRSIQLALKLTF